MWFTSRSLGPHTQRRHPPGPRGHLLTGTAARWREHPHEYMVELVRQYGPMVRYHYAFGRYGYLLTHPAHYRRILQENQRNYDKTHPLYEVMRMALGDGLVTASGDRWLRHRRLMQPAFHRSVLGAVGSVVVARTQAMLARWDAHPGEVGDRHVAVDREMTALTLEVVGEALFGLELAHHADVVSEAFATFSREMLAITTSPAAWLTVRHPVLPSVRRLHAAAGRLRTVVEQIVQTRRDRLQDGDESAGDLLSVLLGAHDANDTAPLSRDEVSDEVATLMLAGHETSATALTWTLYLLSEHPDVEQRLVAELDGVLSGHPPTATDVTRLPYTRAIAQEAMRLYPPIWAFDRRAVAADTVGDLELPAGAFISLSPYVTHRMPELWNAPDQFQPERFLPDAPPVERFAYIPFSAGARGCIGEGFAMTEIILVLATVLQRYRLRMLPGCDVVPQPAITLRPLHRVWMHMTRVA